MRALQFLLLVAVCVYTQASRFSPYGSKDRGHNSLYEMRRYFYHSDTPVKCDYGFRDNGDGQCIDVDECTKGRIIKCGLNADCFNRKGSFDCLCRPGFRENAHKHCVDINECHDELDLCTRNENCFNNVGSYSCLCKAGFTRDHKTKECKKIATKRVHHSDPHKDPYQITPDPYEPHGQETSGYPDEHHEESGYPTDEPHHGESTAYSASR